MSSGFALCKQGSWPGLFSLKLGGILSFSKIEGPLRLRKPEGVLWERFSAGLPSCIYLWLMSRSAVVCCIRDAEAGQRVRSGALGPLCSVSTAEGKVRSVRELLASLSGWRR